MVVSAHTGLSADRLAPEPEDNDLDEDEITEREAAKAEALRISLMGFVGAVQGSQQNG